MVPFTLWSPGSCDMTSIVPVVTIGTGGICSLSLLLLGTMFKKAPTPTVRFMYIFSGIVGLTTSCLALVYESYGRSLDWKTVWAFSSMTSFFTGMTVCSYLLTGVAMYRANSNKKKLGKDKKPIGD